MLDLIYRASLRSGLWGDVTEELGARLQASAGLMMVPASFDGPPIPLALFGINMAAVADIYPQFAGRATFTNLALATGRAPGVFTLDELLPPQQRLDNPIWVNLLAPMRWGSGLISVLRLPQEADGRPVILNFFRDEAERPFGADDVAYLENLFPHLRRSLDLALSTPIEPVPVPLARLVGTLPDPTFLLDRTARVIAANAPAERLIQERDGILERDGRLGIQDRRAQKRLDEALGHAGRVDAFSHLYVGAEFAASREGSPAGLIITVSPVGGTDPLSGLHEQPIALVRIIAPGGRGSKRGLTRVRDLFGLTQAEAEVAAAIGDSLSLRDIAEQRGVTLGTTRLQIKAVFAKIGVNRQSALAALMSDVRR